MENKNFEMFGISGKMEHTLTDLFDVMYDEDDNFFASSKETFEHNEPESNLVFKYKYVIEAEYCEGKVFYSLQLVLLPESLSERKYKNVLNFSGCEPEELNIWDVCSYGLGIIMGTTDTNGETIQPDTLDAIANTMETINSMKGFYLDKFQNRIGNSGWDYLDEYLNDVDSTKVALDRYRTNK